MRDGGCRQQQTRLDNKTRICGAQVRVRHRGREKEG